MQVDEDFMRRADGEIRGTVVMLTQEAESCEDLAAIISILLNTAIAVGYALSGGDHTKTAAMILSAVSFSLGRRSAK